ncbi:hypothetical protein B0T17DRAFT_619118 [Bombardia bombarda]|uniref:Uncharacterized protein n=1 Tax=Bombardia bombarda TaxID=252184 RepID=A0AA39WN86_9PEZI|nr:hypothetical protein B0T17DRAFT_619118 [Bombardia bombarda]
MCKVENGNCLSCGYQDHKLFYPCRDWISKAFPNRLMNQAPTPAPGTHFHCPKFTWCKYPPQKDYICDHCWYETAILACDFASVSEEICDEVQKEINRRVVKREFNGNKYQHTPIKLPPSMDTEPVCGSLDFDNDDVMMDDCPVNLRLQMDARSTWSARAHMLMKTYVHDRTLRDQGLQGAHLAVSETSWLTIWGPKCPLCDRWEADGTNGPPGGVPELEFELNAVAWHRIQRKSLTRIECQTPCRVNLGALRKPCRPCREKEKNLREILVYQISIATNLKWIAKLLGKIPKRRRNDYFAYHSNQSWTDGSILYDGDPALLGNECQWVIERAKWLLEATWRGHTLCDWAIVDAEPTKARLWKMIIKEFK